MSDEQFDVARPGGVLRVGRWGAGPQTVVALHGLTANHVCFEALAEQIDGDRYTLIAPDMRGRGRSGGMDGPFGMEAHADDVVAVMDAAGVPAARLLGHSMGAFVAVVTAARHPGRVSGLVLVDGGLPLDLTGLEGRPVEEIIEAVVGPALARLGRTFTSKDEYLAHWRQHPALASAWSRYVEDVYAYDLEGVEPALRSSVNATAVIDDSASELAPGYIDDVLRRLTRPVTLVRAERGMLDQLPPLYPEPLVEPFRRRLPQMRVVDVAGVNHYTVVLSAAGAARVADVLGA